MGVGSNRFRASSVQLPNRIDTISTSGDIFDNKVLILSYFYLRDVQFGLVGVFHNRILSTGIAVNHGEQKLHFYSN